MNRSNGFLKKSTAIILAAGMFVTVSPVANAALNEGTNKTVPKTGSLSITMDLKYASGTMEYTDPDTKNTSTLPDLNSEISDVRAADDSFYVALYSDEALENCVSDVVQMHFVDASSATAAFADLDPNNVYYAALCDADGTAIDEMEQNTSLKGQLCYAHYETDPNENAITVQAGTTATLCVENYFQTPDRVICVSDNGAIYFENGVRSAKTTVLKIGKYWYNLVNGEVTAGPTVAKNSNGWWYIDENGKVDFTYTGLASNKNGTWRIVKGKVDFTCSGIVTDQTGSYKCTKGKVTFKDNGVIKVGTYWYNLVNSKVTPGPTVARNSNGWWYIGQNGTVEFTYNGLAKNSNGWWKIYHGKVDFTYTGLASNSNGKWFCLNGKVQYRYVPVKAIKPGLWVGDSRTTMLYSSLANVVKWNKVDDIYNGTRFLAQSGMKYGWFHDYALGEIRKWLKANPKGTVVLNMGCNDLDNIESVIKYATADIKALEEEYPYATIKVLSVAPITDSKVTQAYDSKIYNDANVRRFNQCLRESLPDEFVDIYTPLKLAGTDTRADGIHFNLKTNLLIYQIVTKGSSL